MAVAPPKPELVVQALHSILPEAQLLRATTLQTLDRQQQQMLHIVVQHRKRQVTFMQHQAAAAVQITLAVPPDAAQLLQQAAFEQQWQQLDAAWQQARATEQTAWMQLREQQVGAGGVVQVAPVAACSVPAFTPPGAWVGCRQLRAQLTAHHLQCTTLARNSILPVAQRPPQPKARPATPPFCTVRCHPPPDPHTASLVCSASS